MGEFRVTRQGGELAAGRTFGTWGEFRVGLRRYTGDATLEGFEFESGEAYTRFFVDKLDSVNFPRSGYGARAEWTASRTELGADEAFDQNEEKTDA